MKKTKMIFRITALALATVFAALSFACKKEENTLKTPAEICEHAKTLASFPKLEKGNEELLSEIIGIKLDKLDSWELLYSEEGTLADEIAVFKLKDESYRSKLIYTLEQRLKRAASSARDYSPEQYDIILKSTVEEKGRFVFYVVNEKSESIVSELKKLIED